MSEPKYRRIVSGEKDGKSFVAAAEAIEPIVRDNGTKFWGVWGGQDVTRLPTDGTPNWPRTVFPPPNGYRIHFVEFPPAGAEGAEPVGEWPESGLERGYQYSDEPGMHKTDSVDIVIVLEGQIGLEFEDGTLIELVPGDAVVQNGARHAWRYRDVPCRMCFVNLGAVPS
jgi:hypothetical protein